MSYNPYSLNGKTILITGASSGIGRATAVECSKLGARVVITGRNAERLQETYDMLGGGGHLQIVADLVNEEDIEKLAEETPCVDGLVNNAGITKEAPIAYYKKSNLESIFRTNVYAPMLLTKSLIRKKKLNINASIVFVSSIASYFSTLGNGMYGASKAAIARYMHYCARELATKGIRSNSIHPGMVETPLIHGGSISEEQLKQDMSRYINDRYGRPEEIAWAIIYLLSDAAAWITGTELKIDGGVSN